MKLITLPRGQCFIVALFVRAGRVVCFSEAESFAGGSVATSRAFLARQVSAEEPDEVCPSLTCLSLISCPYFLQEEKKIDSVEH